MSAASAPSQLDHLTMVVHFKGKKFMILMPVKATVRDCKNEILRVYTAICPSAESESISELLDSDQCILFDGYQIGMLLQDRSELFATPGQSNQCDVIHVSREDSSVDPSTSPLDPPTPVVSHVDPPTPVVSHVDPPTPVVSHVDPPTPVVSHVDPPTPVVSHVDPPTPATPLVPTLQRHSSTSSESDGSESLSDSDETVLENMQVATDLSQVPDSEGESSSSDSSTESESAASSEPVTHNIVNGGDPKKGRLNNPKKRKLIDVNEATSHKRRKLAHSSSETDSDMSSDLSSDSTLSTENTSRVSLKKGQSLGNAPKISKSAKGSPITPGPVTKSQNESSISSKLATSGTASMSQTRSKKLASSNSLTSSDGSPKKKKTVNVLATGTKKNKSASMTNSPVTPGKPLQSPAAYEGAGTNSGRGADTAGRSSTPMQSTRKKKSGTVTAPATPVAIPEGPATPAAIPKGPATLGGSTKKSKSTSSVTSLPSTPGTAAIPGGSAASGQSATPKGSAKKKKSASSDVVAASPAATSGIAAASDGSGKKKKSTNSIAVMTEKSATPGKPGTPITAAGVRKKKSTPSNSLAKRSATPGGTTGKKKSTPVMTDLLTAHSQSPSNPSSLKNPADPVTNNSLVSPGGSPSLKRKKLSAADTPSNLLNSRRLGQSVKETSSGVSKSPLSLAKKIHSGSVTNLQPITSGSPKKKKSPLSDPVSLSQGAPLAKRTALSVPNKSSAPVNSAHKKKTGRKSLSLSKEEAGVVASITPGNISTLLFDEDLWDS